MGIYKVLVCPSMETDSWTVKTTIPALDTKQCCVLSRVMFDPEKSLDVLALAKELAGLSEGELDLVPLSEALRLQVDEARRIIKKRSDKSAAKLADLVTKAAAMPSNIPDLTIEELQGMEQADIVARSKEIKELRELVGSAIPL